MLNKLSSKINCNYKLYLTILLAIFTILYLSLSGGKYFWTDEAYTLAMIPHSYSEIWKITSADVHPPLYYFIAKTLSAPFGYSFFSNKIISIIPYVLMLALGGIQLKKLFSTKVALVFMIAFFMFPFSLPYAIEVRMYSWAAFFVFSCGIFAYRCFYENSVQTWILFALSGTAAAYTHYFALVSVGIIYVLLLISILKCRIDQLKQWSLASAGTILLYIPWLSSFIKQLIFKVNNDYWIKPITKSTIIGYVVEVFGIAKIPKSAHIVLLLYLFSFILLIIKSEKKSIILSLLLLSIPIGTVAVGVLASVAVRPVFVIRYVVPAIPFLVLFLSIAMGEIKNNIVLSLMLLVILLGGCFNYWIRINKEYCVYENAIDETFIEQHNDIDCYVVQTKENTSILVLAQYAKDCPVYQNPVVSAAMPFENMRTIGDFDYNNNDTVIILLDVGEEPSKYFSTIYNCSFLGTFTENNCQVDAFLLTK